MEIDISILAEEDMFPFSHSVCEGGENAGRNTWNAALDGPRPLLTTAEEFDAFREYVKGFGAWEKKEIEEWSENECQALLLLFIAGDVREAGADTLEEIDWQEYEKDIIEGNVSGNLFKGNDGRIYYSLYI